MCWRAGGTRAAAPGPMSRFNCCVGSPRASAWRCSAPRVRRRAATSLGAHACFANSRSAELAPCPKPNGPSCPGTRSAWRIERDPCTKARLLADRVGLLARHGFATHATALLPQARDAVLELDDGEAFVRLAISEAITSSTAPERFARWRFSTQRWRRLASTACPSSKQKRRCGPPRIDEPWVSTFPVRSTTCASLSSTPAPRAKPRCRARCTWPATIFAIAGLRDDALLCHRDAQRLARKAADLQLCDAIATYPLLIELNEARAEHAAGCLSETLASRLEQRLREAASQCSYSGKRAQIHVHLGEVLRLRARHAEAAKLLDLYLPQGEAEGMGEVELLVEPQRPRGLPASSARCTRGLSGAQRSSHCRSTGQMSHYSRAALLTNLAELELQLGRPEAAARLSARAADSLGPART